MILEVKNGQFSYNGTDITLFENISFLVKQGQILTILGPNGVGKTTLLKCITSLLTWENGETFIKNVPLKKMKSKDIWKNIGYVPQAKNNALPYTVLDAVVMGKSAYIGMWSQPALTDYQEAENLLVELGISHLSKKSCAYLSGGELQLVMIARALLTNPGLMILDEPESHLDFKNQLIVLDKLKWIAKEKNIACIINTHYPEHALRISDTTLMLGKNNEVIYGTTQEILTEANLNKIFGVDVKIVSFEHEGKSCRTIFPIQLSNKNEELISFFNTFK